MYARTWFCMRLCTHAYVCFCLRRCAHVYISLYMRRCAHVSVSMYASVSVYTWIYVKDEDVLAYIEKDKIAKLEDAATKQSPVPDKVMYPPPLMACMYPPPCEARERSC